MEGRLYCFLAFQRSVALVFVRIVSMYRVMVVGKLINLVPKLVCVILTEPGL